MYFTLLGMHVVAVFDSLIAELCENVQIQKLLAFYLVKFVLGFCDPLLE